MTNDYRFKSFTQFLLGPIRERPAMFITENKVSSLSTFIVGFNVGQSMKGDPQISDPFFGENGFVIWFFKTKKVGSASSWAPIILEEAKGDEKVAMDLFFQYVEQFEQENMMV